MAYIPKRLSVEAFNELRDITKDQIEEYMSDEEIEEMGMRVLRFFDILTRPERLPFKVDVTETELCALKFIQTELSHGRSPSIRELTKAVGFKSSKSGFRLVNVLMKKGLVHRDEEGRIGVVGKR